MVDYSQQSFSIKMINVYRLFNGKQHRNIMASLPDKHVFKSWNMAGHITIQAIATGFLLQLRFGVRQREAFLGHISGTHYERSIFILCKIVHEHFNQLRDSPA